MPEQTKVSKVFIISGFLGSGKTSLLKHLLDREIKHNRRPYVIMSEFGDIDIDGLLVSDYRIELKSIVGGCVCCDLRDELALALQEVVKRQPGSTVFIESTGIADPAGIILAILPVIQSGAAIIGNVITVYDASHHPLLGQDRELVKNQLALADTILINKTDLALNSKIKDIIAAIRELNTRAELITTRYGIIEDAGILNRKSGLKIPSSAGATSGSFRSFGFEIESALSRKKLEKWLKTLPESVVRLKGFVKLDNQNGVFEVQSAYGQFSITPFDRPEEPPLMLVLITHPIRMDGLVRRLQSCVAEVSN